MTTPLTAHNPVTQPPARLYRLLVTPSEAAKLGRENEILRAALRYERQARHRERVEAGMSALLDALAARATVEKWSGRKLSARLGISETSLRAIRARRLKWNRWLLRLRQAAARIGVEVGYETPHPPKPQPSLVNR